MNSDAEPRQRALTLNTGGYVKRQLYVLRCPSEKKHSGLHDNSLCPAEFLSFRELSCEFAVAISICRRRHNMVFHAFCSWVPPLGD